MSPKKQLKMASLIGAAAAFFLALAISTGGCSSYNVVPDNVTFDYDQLGPNSKDLYLGGNASLMNTGLELNARPSGPLTMLTGRATYSTPVRLWDDVTGNSASFTTRFTFSIKSDDTQSADGFAFFLAPKGSYNPPNDSSGGAIGLVDPNLLNGTLPPSAAFVAIEVDTYFVQPWDPPCRHIGIDINSFKSVNSTCVDWLDGMIRSGGLINASITYDSSSGNLSAVLTGNGFPGNNAAVSHVVGLKEYLPEQVVIGFAASTGALFELHTIKSWDFSSNILVAAQNEKPVPRKGNTATVLAVSISGSILVFGLILGFAWCRLCSRKEMQEEEDDIISIDQEFGEVAGPKRFSYEELVNATDGFHEGRLLGRGGFGKVYEGIIRGTGLRVAIKRISPESKQGVKEYATEVITISQLRHRNLVQLIGWCHRKKDLLLIYEFMSNGSLDSHLFHSLTPMSWGTRYKILREVASAVLYLHEGWESCVIHRDIKCSNIMLDSDFCAKLGDFGLARLVDHSKGSRTTVTAGTFGYMAPESFYAGKSSKESDVYSFGVVLLEIVCGRTVIDTRAGDDRENLVNWVRKLYHEGIAMDAVDESLGGNFNPTEAECVLTVGLWCTHPSFSFRPSMREAISTLNLDSPLPTFPPAFWNELYAGSSYVPQSSSHTATTTGSGST
ncbi:hypothetical protein MLD38_001429 [Melastoma candidum]|uniref:Uncharacterized protein n=1 Tax=Melastoma candidum TaxID=119954 RepID=A0ACB9SDB0_9MYRT|nr:hypothetical protein MLD38_001429 [Melastoma candidum]